MKMRGIFSSLTVSPLWRRRGEKNELLEEQEKFVNFWSSYSLPRFGGGVEKALIFFLITLHWVLGGKAIN